MGREGVAMGEQEAPAQHLLDENVGRRVPAKLLGPSAVTSSSGYWRPDQTFITAERRRDGGGRGTVGGGGALKIQQGASVTVWRRRGLSAVHVALDWDGSLEGLGSRPREDGSKGAQREGGF